MTKLVLSPGELRVANLHDTIVLIVDHVNKQQDTLGQLLLRMDEQEDGQHQLQSATSDLMQTLEQSSHTREAAELRLTHLEETVKAQHEAIQISLCAELQSMQTHVSGFASEFARLETVETRFKELEHEMRAQETETKSQLKASKMKVAGLEGSLRSLSEEIEGRLGTRLAEELAKHQEFEAEVRTKLKDGEVRLGEVAEELTAQKSLEAKMNHGMQVISDLEGDVRAGLKDLEARLAKQMEAAESYVEGLKEDFTEQVQSTSSSLKLATENRLTKLEGAINTQERTNGYSASNGASPIRTTSPSSPRQTTSPRNGKARGSALMRTLGMS